MNEDAAALAAVGIGMIIGAIIGLAIYLAITGFICYLLQTFLKRLPAEHQKIEPWKIWLLMIPCFPIVWNFFVYPALSDSYNSYFQSIGKTDVGDCGKQLATIFSITVAASCLISFVPFIGLIGTAGSIAALVILIIYLIKINELKNQIPTT